MDLGRKKEKGKRKKSGPRRGAGFRLEGVGPASGTVALTTSRTEALRLTFADLYLWQSMKNRENRARRTAGGRPAGEAARKETCAQAGQLGSVRNGLLR
jgi:hypothetical protein